VWTDTSGSYLDYSHGHVEREGGRERGREGEREGERDSIDTFV